MNLHGSLGIQIDAHVAYPAGSLDKIFADACGFLGGSDVADGSSHITAPEGSWC